ncbi:tRNA lysidine(34) synthetase TilS [Pseudalkalibacillus salsuginis]|uniref:tRNA lysidine(34) synthetase TilS n=1 Tax=Pseudalkalibacillus salsuginis TaxID=2910972 RepID=UPI001F42F500|nr:tRNA lysidine(34) synthetase TilS [Pseudalkalibacillus salsuginis]MCF6411905.1 tRNA lysidine(34) synthetase TilS [Pseudalkalibacillus salsuginis]
MFEAVDQFVRQNKLFTEGATVVIGVSGGPDSMALLDYFMKKRTRMDLQLVVAHVDHMFRGKESAEDADFVQQYCISHGISIERIQKNLPLYIERTGESPQQAARRVRYEFFAAVMQQYDAECLALAHHGDDQIETMLMNMVRGAGHGGLSGIPVARFFSTGRIIRPFLGITKDELVHYCKDENIPYRIDPSNMSDKYKRNRFRENVLPFLKEENPAVHEKFQQLSDRLKEDEDYLHKQTEKGLVNVILQKCDKELTLSVPGFLKMAIPLQRRGIHLILNYLYQSDPSNITSSHIKDCIRLMKSENPSGTIHLPGGLFSRREYDKCVFTFQQPEDDHSYSYQLELGRMYELPVGKLIFSSLDRNAGYREGKNQFIFQPSQLQLPLFVRTREEGDRLHPAGIKGSKKVKDVFIDAKLPKQLRDSWPIVTDSSGKILWIPGVKHADIGPADGTDDQWMSLYFQNTRHEV